MELSFKVSEANYRQAWKLRSKSPRSKVIKVVFCWIFILVCLMLLWAVVQHGSQQPVVAPQPPVETGSTGHTIGAVTTNVGPFILLADIWAFLVIRRGPMRLRRLYQRDPSMQGQFTASITAAGISMQNTAGISSQSGWDLYEFWRDGKDIIVLVFRSGTYCVLGLTGLSEVQRNELQGILSVALQKKYFEINPTA